MPSTRKKQTTLATSISYTGIGLHSGKIATVVFRPLPVNSGIVFVRVDLPGKPMIPAQAQFVSATVRATTLTNNGAEVFTIEHLMAALFMAGIDNCQVELDGPEPPVADGSSLPFIELFNKVGFIEQSADKQIFPLDRTFSVHDNERYITVIPYAGQRFSFLSINSHPLLGTQYFDVEYGKDDLYKEIAPSRTIAFMHEVEELKRNGLGLGGNSENVIVYDDDKVLTPLRFADELVRHKLLDLLGDLFLAGSFYGHVIAVVSGHALNTALAKKIAKYIQEGENGIC